MHQELLRDQGWAAQPASTATFISTLLGNVKGNVPVALGAGVDLLPSTDPTLLSPSLALVFPQISPLCFL